MDGKETMHCPFCGGEMNVVNDGILTRMPPIKIYTAVCCGCSSRIEVRGDDGESKMRSLDNRLMPDGMTWPMWKDGSKVRIGDAFTVAGDNTACFVECMSFEESGATIGDYSCVPWDIDECSKLVPDTQERIDADARKTTCEFFGVKKSTPCQECPASHKEDSCDTMMHLDLLRRQRELDKREAEK